ncbi:hypothetical protein WJX84_005607 [Apatococcus fuscideae]|uniref:Protein kinase domain-containing protein n=1 Tax=Apatococcus fuscideae TaxID=2026836 RepID=A0AAW1SXD9_9CHLO
MQRSHWCVEDYELSKQLYKGKASLLFAATCQRSRMPVALKLYRKSKLSDLNWYQVEREIRLHAALQHEHIIQLYGAFEDEKHVYLAQEFATGGDLYEELKRLGGQLKERRVARDIIQPCLSALAYMHSMGIIHRDIKPENILLTMNGKVKFADFGLSINARAERPVTRAGTLDYMAPEVLVCPEKSRPEENKDKQLLGYTALVDAWAMGILAFELIVGRPPFEKESRAATYEHIMYRKANFPAWLSDDSRDFITMALAKAARKRPCIGDMLKHNWLAIHQRRRSGRESGFSVDDEAIASHRTGLQPQGSSPLPIALLAHKESSAMESDASSMSTYQSMDAMAISPRPKPGSMLESTDSGGISGVFTWASTSMKQILNGSQNGVRRLLKPGSGLQRTQSREDSDMALPPGDRPTEGESAPETPEAVDASMDSGHLAPIAPPLMDLTTVAEALPLDMPVSLPVGSPPGPTPLQPDPARLSRPSPLGTPLPLPPSIQMGGAIHSAASIESAYSTNTSMSFDMEMSRDLAGSRSGLIPAWHGSKGEDLDAQATALSRSMPHSPSLPVLTSSLVRHHSEAPGTESDTEPSSSSLTLQQRLPSGTRLTPLLKHGNKPSQMTTKWHSLPDKRRLASPLASHAGASSSAFRAPTRYSPSSTSPETSGGNSQAPEGQPRNIAMQSPFAVEAAKYTAGNRTESQSQAAAAPTVPEAPPNTSTKAYRFINPLTRRRAHAGHHSGSGSGGLMSPRVTNVSGLQPATSINSPVLASPASRQRGLAALARPGTASRGSVDSGIKPPSLLPVAGDHRLQRVHTPHLDEAHPTSRMMSEHLVRRPQTPQEQQR